MMERLRQELRAVYDRQQAGLGNPAEARRRLIQGALEGRDEPVGGRLQFAAGIAAILLAAIVVATFAYVRAGAGPHLVGPAKPSPVPTVPQTPRPSAGEWILDAAPLDASTGWILLTNCIQPMTGKCKYFVQRTADGGRTWAKAVQVGPSFDPTDGDAPRSIRFVNASDGFVYGGTAAFATHDGGRSWGSIGVHPTFFAAATGHGDTAWVVTYPCAKGTVCGYEVRSSTNAGRTWSSPFSLPAGFSPQDAIPIGGDGLLISSEPSGDMELTLDGGASWRLIQTPCTGNVYRSIGATADGNELWDLCLDYPNVTTAKERLFVSEDGGQSWTLRMTSQVSGDQVQIDYSTVLVSTRAGTALMAPGRSTIEISHDSGVTWAQVGPAGVSFQSIRFANPNEGWAIDIYQNIWVTTDGGDHWGQAGTT